MSDFRPIFEGIQRARLEIQAGHHALVQSNAYLQQAAVAMQQAGVAQNQSAEAMQRSLDMMLEITNAAIHARQEHDDRQVTVDELKTLVLDLSGRVNALTTEVERLRNGRK